MRRLSPLNSGAFRFALMVAAIFVVGALALLLTVDWAVGRYATEVARDSVTTEATVLSDEDRTAGRGDMVRSIWRRESAAREHQLRYLLTDRAGHALAGSLPLSAAHLGWSRLTLANAHGEVDDDPGPVPLMTLGVRLTDGGMVVVGSDSNDLAELRRGLGLVTALFGAAISLLALVGGLVVGSLFLRRLDRVNRAVALIIEGRLTERLPAIGMSPEFDHLSANLNLMLDRIESLLEGLRQVSTDIAHDLRTPLTRLRQRLEALKDRESGAVLEEQIDEALAQTDEILKVFKTLLRISAFEAGAGSQRTAKVNLSEMFDRTFQAYRPVAEDAGRVITARIQPGLEARGDGDMLTQAVANLIENAIVHTPMGSHIRMSLEGREGAVVLAVADDGPGVPVAERDKILQRFYRLDASRGAPGAGLGLALVSAIAAIHRGRLVLSDNNPGLKVEILIPAVAA